MGICGTIVEIMQVYTTIFLAETSSPSSGSADESWRDSQDRCDLREIKRTNLERITILESRNWFVDDLPLDD